MAEDLPNVYVWVSSVEGGDDRENQYFYDNIRMELLGAGYKLAESRENSDFFMNIRVVHEGNEGAPLNYVSLSLYDSRTENEIITLSWDYDRLEDMDIWNLYLVLQTMANAPIAKSVLVPGEEATPPAEAPSWYSKWLWIGAAGGADYFPDRPHLDIRLTAGLDFSDFMSFSTGLGYQVNFPLTIEVPKDRYYHQIEQSLILPMGLKFLIKTENFFVEPNGGIQFQIRFPGSYAESMDHRTGKNSPALLPAIFGGLDIRAKLGPGALVLGPRILYDFETADSGFGFTLGYQFGFFPKKPKAPKPDPVSLVREESLEEALEEVPEEAAVPEADPEESAPEEAAAPEADPEEGAPEAGNPEAGGLEEDSPENPEDFNR